MVKNKTVIMLSLMTGVILIPLKGLVVLCYWRWFVQPLGAPEIGLAHVLGLLLLIAFVTKKVETKRQEETFEDLKNRVWTNLLLLVLLSIVGQLLAIEV